MVNDRQCYVCYDGKPVASSKSERGIYKIYSCGHVTIVKENVELYEGDIISFEGGKKWKECLLLDYVKSFYLYSHITDLNQLSNHDRAIFEKMLKRSIKKGEIKIMIKNFYEEA